MKFETQQLIIKIVGATSILALICALISALFLPDFDTHIFIDVVIMGTSGLIGYLTGKKEGEATEMEDEKQ